MKPDTGGDASRRRCAVIGLKNSDARSQCRNVCSPQQVSRASRVCLFEAPSRREILERYVHAQTFRRRRRGERERRETSRLLMCGGR